MPIDVPPLPESEIHVWRFPWRGGAESDAALKAVLAAYAGPAMPQIVRGPHGKPHFTAPFDTLGFSWSHSRDTALFAVGKGPGGFEVGVDVERVRPRARARELAARFFAPEESDWLNGLPDDHLLHGFLSLWTAKEAVLKAHGGGLSYGLHRIAFTVGPEGPDPTWADGEIAPAQSWQVRPVPLGEGLVAAVAWRGSARTVRVFTSPL